MYVLPYRRLVCPTMHPSVALTTSSGGSVLGLLDRPDVSEALAAVRRPVAIVGSAQGPRAVLLDDAGLLTP
jgi:hypothetical protein